MNTEFTVVGRKKKKFLGLTLSEQKVGFHLAKNGSRRWYLYQPHGSGPITQEDALEILINWAQE